MAIYKPQYKDDNGQIQDLNLPYINIYNDTYNIDPTIHWQFVDTTKYTPIEYVIFSGTNYINNNGILTEKTEYSLKLNFKTLGSGAFGLFGNYDNTQYLVKNTSTANIQWYYGSENQTGSPGFSTDTIYTISVRDKKLYVDDTVVITMTNSQTFSVTPYYIGNRYSASSVTNGLNGNLYEFTIIDDKVTHVYKPVYEISTNYVGFVDTLTGDFYPLKIYGSSSSITYTSGTTGGPEVTSNLDYVSNINNLIDSKVAIGGKDTWKDVTARGNISNGPIQIGGPLNLDSNSNTYIAFGTTSNPMAKNAFITSYNNGFIMGANTKSLYFLMEDALRPTTNDNGKSLNLGNTTRGWNNLYLSKNGKTGSSAGGTIVFSDNNTSNTKTTTLKDSATVARTLTLPDKTGTLAITDDIGNATINFSVNGNTLSDSFTTNDATNKTINIGSNFVTTDTNQTITGHKTFTQRPGLQVTRIPETYQEVEYIQLDAYYSSAASSYLGNYINTGLVITQADSLSIEFDGQWNGVNSNFATFFGFMKSTSDVTPRLAVSIYQNHYMIGIDATVSGTSTPTQTRHKYKFNTASGLQKLAIDNVTEVETSYSSSTLTTNTLPLYIGARNTGNSATNFSGITIYSFYISTGTENYSYIPCYRKSDNQLGLYEINNHEFYPVEGTGTPTKGNDVVDSEFLVYTDLAQVAISNNYNDLDNKPSIPTYTLSSGDTANIVKLTSSTGTAQTVTVNNVANATKLNNQAASYYLDWNNFSGVPTNFVYTDTTQTISGTKTFTTTPIISDGSSHIAITYKADANNFTYYKDDSIVKRVINSGTPSDVTLAFPSTGGTLATTSDIKNGTLTLQVNGTTKTSFTANQSSAATFNVTASDLGLSQAMKFIGVSTTDPTSATGATISGHTAWAKGQVVIYKRNNETYYEEYINITGSNTSSSTPNPNWELLGDADSYALKSVKITGDGALGGGGTLEQNRTITHNAGNAPNKTSGWYKFSTDAYSHISGTTAVTSSDIAEFLADTGNVSFTNNNNKISASVTFPVSDVQTKTTTSGSYVSVVTSNIAKIDLSGYATLAGTQTISGKKTFSHSDGVISTSKFVVDTQPITTVYEETAIIRTDNQAGNITQTLNYPAFTSTSQNLTLATIDKIKNGLLTINVNDDESEFYANSASDVYVTITLPRVKRYI